MQKRSKNQEKAMDRDPEVSERPVRRTFTAEYKRTILEEADRCLPGSGGIGTLLRREGLYSTHLTYWRRQRDEGALDGLSRKRGAKRRTRHPLARENEQLKRDVDRLRQRLDQARRVIDIQKKVSEVFGIAMSEREEDDATR